MTSQRPPAWTRNPDDSQQVTVARAAEPEGVEAVHEQLDKLTHLLKRCRRHWAFGLIGVAIVAVGVAFFALRFEPGYKSETVIFHQDTLNPESLAGGGGMTDPTILRELLLQRGRMEKLVNDLNLHQDTVERLGIGVAVDELRETIQFRAIGKSTFKITFVGDSPEQAQEVTAWLANQLVEEDLKRRQAQALKTKAFLEKELARAQEDLTLREEAKGAFMARHPEVAARAAGLSAPDPRPSTADPRPASKKKPTRKKTMLVPVPVRPKGSGAPPPRPPPPKPKVQPPDPQLVAERQAALSELAAAARSLAQLQTTYTDKHPEVQAAKQRVAAAEKRVKAATDALAPKTPDDIYELEPKPQPAPPRPSPAPQPANKTPPKKIRVSVPVPVGKKKKHKDDEEEDEPEPMTDVEPGQLGELETEWMRLDRLVTEARNRTERLAAEAFGAEVASRSRGAGHDARVVVLDEAYKPSTPIRSRLYFVKIGLPVAFLLAIALVLARALLDDRIYEVADIKSVGPQPLLSVIPGTDNVSSNV